MASNRAAVVLGTWAFLFAARVSLADPSAPCQPACAAGQVCTDGACAPASGGGAATPPKLAATPSRAPATAPRWREGFLALPSIGMNSFQGDAGSNLGPGLRVGVLVGSRMAENWSLNVGADFDIANVNAPAGSSVSAYFLDIGFNPLIHLPLPKLELVAGPVVGTWAEYGHSSAFALSVDSWSYGWTIGANAGLLFPVGAHTEVGGLVSFLLREPLKVCDSASSGTDRCFSDNLQSAKTLALALAAMF
jgi:hypothetical protein